VPILILATVYVIVLVKHTCHIVFFENVLRFSESVVELSGDFEGVGTVSCDVTWRDLNKA